MMGLINFSNLLCHSLFSILPAFFPQEAKTKGMSEDAVGIVFACFPAVIFLTSPFAGPFMSRHGKKWVYTTGLIVVSVSTMCFSFASYLPAGSPFATWCLFIRLLQARLSTGPACGGSFMPCRPCRRWSKSSIGTVACELMCFRNCYTQGLGSAMEETAAYAIIAELDAQNVSLFMGLTEISTGLVHGSCPCRPCRERCQATACVCQSHARHTSYTAYHNIPPITWSRATWLVHH